MPNISVTGKIRIRRPVEEVWDYTQNWSHRHVWDPTVLSVTAIGGAEGSEARYRVRGKRGLEFTVQYELFDRPNKTSVAIVDSTSRLVSGGGSSWTYTAVERGTEFVQHNTLTIDNSFLAWLFGGFLRRNLARATETALWRAKKILEGTNKRAYP